MQRISVKAEKRARNKGDRKKVLLGRRCVVTSENYVKLELEYNSFAKLVLANLFVR